MIFLLERNGKGWWWGPYDHVLGNVIILTTLILPIYEHGKDSDAGRDWGQEEKGTTEDEMAGWHH